MRLTIERMRTMVLAAGLLLVLSLVAFLVIGKFKNPFKLPGLPKRLGIEIQQEANGVTYTQAHGGHTLFKIHASKVVQLKQGNATLHDVRIELYGADGSRVDRIEGSEFEYDQKAGTAKAAGQVEITVMRPGVAPAIAPKATPGQVVGSKANPLASAVDKAASGEIHVKTSGLTFDQNTGMAATRQRVEFDLAQGSGSAQGAVYDSGKGLLTLDHAVELTTRRGPATLTLHAAHAEFERDDQLCRMTAATADYQGGQAAASQANIEFRDNGSAERLDASSGFTLTTNSGSRLAAPTGQIEFDEHNQPHHGRLTGGVTMDGSSQARGTERVLHGTAPTADLQFTSQGGLRHAHLERGVELDSTERSQAGSEPLRSTRHWRSPVADAEFREAGHGRMELASIHGAGGVAITGESQRGQGPVTPSRVQADDITGQFAEGSTLTAITGAGHALIEQTTPKGDRQTTSGDRLDVRFSADANPAVKAAASRDAAAAGQIQAATVDGHVILLDQPAAKPGVQPPAPLRATAGHAVYESEGQWLRLTLSPRVESGGLQLTSDKIDVSQASGDAFARGNVKATWLESPGPLQQKAVPGTSALGGIALGGQGPAHAVAAEAQLQRASGETTFRGQARLWQQANSIAAPVIVIDRTRQTLTARATDPADPVRAVLLSAAALTPGREGAAHQASPTLIRVRGSDLKYSDAEHKAVIHGGAAGGVVAELGAVTVSSSQVELALLPPGNHAGKDSASAQVDRMTARGQVVLISQGRRGTGDQLTFANETGDYVLTGTAAAPPRMTDPVRGSVTGEALIFHSRDDSVSIEGGGRKTTTQTTAPK